MFLRIIGQSINDIDSPAGDFTRTNLLRKIPDLSFNSAFGLEDRQLQSLLVSFHYQNEREFALAARPLHHPTRDTRMIAPEKETGTGNPKVADFRASAADDCLVLSKIISE